jgi:bacteriocin-like protein
MKTLNTNELETVAGGASKSDQLTQTLTTVQSSIKDLAASKNNSSNDMMLPMVMMMAMNRPAPTVVTTGAAAPVAAGPIVNISNRIGRRW